MSTRYETPDFELDDYPLNRAQGQMELLDATTIYYWEGKYWLAVLKVRSTFGDVPKNSIRVYRWQWKPDRNKNVRWLIDQKFNINKLHIWNDVKKAVEDMFATL